MCRHSETQHNILEPIRPVIASQDPPFKYVALDPDNNRDPYICGDTIRFVLPPEGILYPESLQFFFNLRTNLVSAIGGRGWTFANDIRILFQYCRVFHGSTLLLDDIQEFGQLAMVLDLYNSDTTLVPLTNTGYLTGQQLQTAVSNLTTVATDRTNYHNVVNANTNAPGQIPRRYMANLNLGFLHSKQKPIPLQAFKERLVIELKLQESIYQTGVWSGAAQPVVAYNEIKDTLRLGRVQLHMKLEYGNYELDAAIAAAIRSSKLQYQWDSWYFQRVPLNNRTLTHRIPVQCFQKRIKYAIACLRSESDQLEADQDPTAMYCSLNPNATVPNSTTVTDESRRTTLKQYQWRYNQRMFPETPVQVLGVRVPETATSASTSLGYPTFQNFTSSGAEAWYYLNETLAPGKTLLGPFTQDFPWVIMDAVSASTTFVTTRQNTAITGGSGTTTNPCAFVIAGKFSYTSIDSNSTYAIDGKSLNSKLELILDFNAFSIDPAAGPNMFLDIWVAYDNVLTVQDDGSHLLDN
jgi:hypothetical protein